MPVAFVPSLTSPTSLSANSIRIFRAQTSASVSERTTPTRYRHVQIYLMSWAGGGADVSPSWPVHGTGQRNRTPDIEECSV
ncbi:hypothetical protein PHSY_004442 [Pseudozyma hubeiensis SY62]|uniref:Uncharacterized protein n=1 Tax=Pseudozyma hubeiensis (strain SY62) TaxID=1305764 RepID=R9P642_PSEHS|nr:hypothetical protein PHSY_004442 [Pseudozyma hubeiensis SY62]GAC96858.1 hypothetical protein PHSY_004442 [Pseudozyma hubeiensis SY62]